MIEGVNLANVIDETVSVSLQILNKSQLICLVCQRHLVASGACGTHRHCSDDAPSWLIEAAFLGDVGY